MATNGRSGSDVRVVGASLDVSVSDGATTGVVVGELLAALERVGAEERARVTLQAPRRPPGARRGTPTGAAGPATAKVAVPPPLPGQGQVLLVHDDDAVRWVLPDTAPARRRGTSAVPTTFTLTIDDAPESTVTRGLVGKLVKKGLHVLTFDLVDKVLGEVTDHFARRWEAGARRPRLRLVTAADYTRDDVADLDAAAIAALAAGPALLLVHGTNSRTHTGFGRFTKAQLDELCGRYGGRVFAFDHPTISVDPFENGRWLAQHLPPDAGLTVDVLAHSRGGLVARGLVERPGEVGLAPEQLRVRQVVFVATPNAGTPLADPKRLGQLVDGLTNVIDLVPDNPVSPALDAVSGVLSVVKQLAVGAMAGLDGLVSMCPAASDERGFLAGLNTAHDHEVRYRAIAADYEPAPGSGLGRIARDTAVDLLFGEANDLIVPTASAYQWNGASAFPITERVVVPADGAVDHSGYWTAPAALDALTGWLAADAPLEGAGPARAVAMPAVTAAAHGIVAGVPGAPRAALQREPDVYADVDARFAAGDLDGVRAAIAALPDAERIALRTYVGGDVFDAFAQRGARRGARAGRGGGAGATRVYVLPGIMGSLLSVRDGGDTDRIWANPLRLMAGQFRRLTHTGREQVVVDGPHRTYLRLVMTLDRSWDVVPFGFDWRLDLESAADRLAAELKAHGAPAHLVAHSMGGLVCRLLYARHRRVWDAMAGGNGAAGGRAVLLGTPSLGSLSIASALTGDDKMVRLLAGADLLNDLDETRDVLCSFPGVYDLLPSPDAAVADSDHAALYDAGRWPAGGIRQDGLDGAKAMHRTLRGAGVDAGRMFYVAGSGHATPMAVRIDPGGLRYRTTTAGDGRVTHDSGLGRDRAGTALFSNVWYSPAGHGDLPKDDVVIAAVDEILRTGRTNLLSPEPVGLQRGAVTAGGWMRGDELEPIADLDIDLTRGIDDSVRGAVARRRRSVERARRIVDESTTSWLGIVPMSEPVAPTLALTVTHASLEHARHLVILGHYAGTPIAGAEWAANAKLDGRLAQHQLLGRYPQQPGDVLRVEACTTPYRSFEGVAVIGLGEVGELTPTALARAVRAAALERALAELACDAVGRAGASAGSASPAGATKVIGVSAVPVGSYGPDGLQLPTVVAALLEGVVLANRELAQLEGHPVRIGELEIVELYANRAEALTAAARDIEVRMPASVLDGVELRPPARLVRGEGGRPGAPEVDYGQGMWRRMIVSGPAGVPAAVAGRRARRGLPPTVPLSFTSLGARARADVLDHVIDNRLVGSMVEGAIESPRADADVNVALFELLLPNDLKRELVSVENLVLVVDEETADIPWEAMADRRALSGTEALVTRMGLVRQLKLAERRAEETGPLEASALVIGNPPTGFLESLPGAAAEARAVVAKLEQNELRVRSLVFDEGDGGSGDGAADVVGALLGADYQIVHIAAHGGFDPADGDDAPNGGVVLGPGRYLTAREFGQMRRPPALVFLNCCNLGSVSARNPERDPSIDAATVPPQAVRTTTRAALAASLSRTLMAMGVKAVVAAGWSVDDRAALAFSTVFYEAMLSGESFGEAVTMARAAAHRSDGGASNTWAAYQCYGDPGFRLARAQSHRSGSPRFVSAAQLVRAADELAVQAGDHEADHDRLVARVREVEAALGVPPPAPATPGTSRAGGAPAEASEGRSAGTGDPLADTVRAAAADSWYRGGAVWASLGAAYGECGAFEDAVRCYSVALWCADGAASLRAVEQLVNLSVRRAASLGDSVPSTPGGRRGVASGTVFRRVAGIVDALETLPRSPERLAIIARFRKAQAVAAAPGTAARRRAAVAAVTVYDESWRGGGEAYCALVAVQLDALFKGLLSAERRKALLADIAAPRFGDNASGFWERVGHTDLALTNAIVDRRLGKRDDGPLVAGLIEGYSAAFDSRSTEREALSPVRHVADLAALAPPGGMHRSLLRLHAALVDIAAAR